MKQSKSMALELDDEDGFDSWNDHELNVCYDVRCSCIFFPCILDLDEGHDSSKYYYLD